MNEDIQYPRRIMEPLRLVAELSAEIDCSWRLIAESRRLLHTADQINPHSSVLIETFRQHVKNRG